MTWWAKGFIAIKILETEDLCNCTPREPSINNYHIRDAIQGYVHKMKGGFQSSISMNELGQSLRARRNSQHVRSMVLSFVLQWVCTKLSMASLAVIPYLVITPTQYKQTWGEWDGASVRIYVNKNRTEPAKMVMPSPLGRIYGHIIRSNSW